MQPTYQQNNDYDPNLHYNNMNNNLQQPFNPQLQETNPGYPNTYHNNQQKHDNRQIPNDFRNQQNYDYPNNNTYDNSMPERRINGNCGDWCCGFIIGLCFNILAIFLLIIPDFRLNRLFTRGVLAGIVTSCLIAFGVFFLVYLIIAMVHHNM